LLTLKELLVSLAPELITLFQKLMNKYKLEEIKNLTMCAKTSNQILKVMTRFFKDRLQVVSKRMSQSPFLIKLII